MSGCTWDGSHFFKLTYAYVELLLVAPVLFQHRSLNTFNQKTDAWSALDNMHLAEMAGSISEANVHEQLLMVAPLITPPTCMGLSTQRSRHG